MRPAILTLLVLSLLTSCITSRPERLEAKRQRKCELAAYRWGCNNGYDSVMIIRETRTVYSDTTIFVHIPGDTVMDTLFVFITEDGLINSKPSMLETSFASSWAQVVDGKLYHDLVQNDTAIEARIKNGIRETTSTETWKQSTVVTMYVNRLTWWQKVEIIGFYILIAFLVGIFGILFFRKEIFG